MSRSTIPVALVAVTALVVAWLLLASGTVPHHHLVIPQPTYLTGRLVSLLVG